MIKWFLLLVASVLLVSSLIDRVAPSGAVFESLVFFFLIAILEKECEIKALIEGKKS